MNHERRIPVSLTPDCYDILAACGRVLGKTMNQMLDESVETLAIKQSTTVQGLTGGGRVRPTRGDRGHLRRGAPRAPPSCGPRTPPQALPSPRVFPGVAARTVPPTPRRRA